MWQVLYEELAPRGLAIVAVALDAGGAPATRPFIAGTQADYDAVPEMLAPVMGWGEAEWAARRPPTFPCLIDAEHRVAELYHVHNVPIALWIDEQGTIVRPNEAPGYGDWMRRMDRETFEVPDEDRETMIANRRTYFDALRDWVAKGADSAFVLPADEVRRRMQTPAPDDVRAALHARIGQLVFERDDWRAAKRHFEAAVALSPDKWNYIRQSMTLEPGLVGELNTADEYWEARDRLGSGNYYPTMDMPGIQGEPPWLKDGFVG